MSMTPEQRKIAAFDYFFATHINVLRENHVDDNIDPIDEFVNLIETNDIQISDNDMMNTTQALFDILDNKNRASTFSFEGGKVGDNIAYDLHDYMSDNDGSFVYDDYTYLYRDDGSELFVCYMSGNSYIHIEVGLSDYVKHFVIELR